MVFDPHQPREVQLMLSDLAPEEQRRVWRRACGRVNRARLGPLIVGFLVAAILFLPIPHPTGLIGCLVVATAFFGSILADRINGKFAVLYVRRELAVMGRCAGCGYDLRTSIGTCPECGAPI